MSIGPADAARIVFSGAVSAIEASFTNGVVPSVTAFAEDKLMKLRMTRRMKTYENMTDADIAQAIASEHGTQASASADGPTYKVVQQWNQSDLAFLRERARLIQAELWFADNTLHFATRGNRTATTLSLVLGDDLLEAQLRADLAHQRHQGESERLRRLAARDAIDEEAGADAIQAEISGGRTGPAVLQQAFGERVSFRVRGDPLVSGEAHAWANAEMLRRARGFVTVVGTTAGSPTWSSAASCRSIGWARPSLATATTSTRVCHTYDLIDGFRTHFDAERATVNEGGS